MNNISIKIKKLESIRDSMYKDVDVILNKYKKDIVNLNYNQMRDGIGSNGGQLFNVLPNYNGYYSNISKKRGLYDFFETGRFKRGLFAIINKNTAEIDSSGKGDGEKLLFFNSYTNLFGLDDESIRLLRDKVMPEIRKKLKNRL